MICKNCNKEFDTWKHGLICPYCKQKVDLKTFDNVDSAVKCLFDIYGVEILKNDKKFIGLINDIIPKLTREKNLFAAMQRERIFMDIYDAINKDDNEKNIIILLCVERLVNNEGLSESTAMEAINYIIDVLFWNLKFENSSKQNPIVKKVSQARNLMKRTDIIISCIVILFIFFDFYSLNQTRFTNNNHVSDSSEFSIAEKKQSEIDVLSTADNSFEEHTEELKKLESLLSNAKAELEKVKTDTYTNHANFRYEEIDLTNAIIEFETMINNIINTSQIDETYQYYILSVQPCIQTLHTAFNKAVEITNNQLKDDNSINSNNAKEKKINNNASKKDKTYEKKTDIKSSSSNHINVNKPNKNSLDNIVVKKQEKSNQTSTVDNIKKETNSGVNLPPKTNDKPSKPIGFQD